MKKIFVLAAFAVAFADVQACDVCGCSANGYSLGIVPKLNNHFVGVKHQYRTFKSEHPVLFADEVAEVSTEQFHTTEFWGRYNPHKRVQLYGFVPYNYYLKTESGKKTSVAGLGDISLLANYVAFQTPDSSVSLIRHNLLLGGGLKLPPGKHNANAVKAEPLNPNMQPGTGSVDFIANANYTLRYRNWGLSSDAAYRYNLANAAGYKFGNRINSGVRAFYWRDLLYLQGVLLPQVGVAHEFAQKDYLNQDTKEVNDFSGGHILSLTGGIDFFTTKYSVSFSYSHPVWQNVADGYVTNQLRVTAGINFLIDSSKTVKK
ncbi:MAG: hypothetical protein LPJ89_03245 [Hymenobacteraceae bacterium]|nr:hypothetical protein [Hymenobacteraceae bacterium]